MITDNSVDYGCCDDVISSFSRFFSSLWPWWGYLVVASGPSIMDATNRFNFDPDTRQPAERPDEYSIIDRPMKWIPKLIPEMFKTLQQHLKSRWISNKQLLFKNFREFTAKLVINPGKTLRRNYLSEAKKTTSTERISSMKCHSRWNKPIEISNKVPVSQF